MTIIDSIAKPLRRAITSKFPNQTAKLRDTKSKIKRLRALDERVRLLEHRSHPGIAPDRGIHSWECSTFSQNGEDGILLHLFSCIGGQSCRFLEFGSGNGVECNSANLALGFGWSGMLIDADPLNVDKAARFFGTKLGRRAGDVHLLEALVTPDNINALIRRAADDAPSLDLLSIDVDGNDYWLWQAVQEPAARVVVVEYNATFGPDLPVTVEFDPAFDRYQKHPSGFYHGASLAALYKLALNKGYQLVGCDSAGVNAFFVLSELGADLPALTPSAAYVPLHERAAMTVADQFCLVRHLPLIEV